MQLQLSQEHTEVALPTANLSSEGGPLILEGQIRGEDLPSGGVVGTLAVTEGGVDAPQAAYHMSLEWLRTINEDQAATYLMNVAGLGRKSTG